jgi:hypothetical protein
MASPAPQFPLSGRDIDKVPRSEVILASGNAPVLYEWEGAKVTRVHDTAVLKSGRTVRITEGKNMEFVRQFASINIPTVIDVWENDVVDERTRTGYLLMEYIEGSTVEDVWTTLEPPVQLSIQHQVYDAIQQLQAIRFSRPGPVSGGRSIGFLFPYDAGPFTSTEDLEDWFNRRLAVCKTVKIALDQPSFSGTFKPLVMCHLDLLDRNLMLDKRGRVWILDWSHSGGYPPWFEWKILKSYFRPPSYVPGLLTLMGDKYPNELKNLENIGYALNTGAIMNRNDIPELEGISHDLPELEGISHATG